MREARLHVDAFTVSYGTACTSHLAETNDLCIILFAGWNKQSTPLTVYGIQLLLNFLWTPLFFKAHKLGWASLDIIGKALQCQVLLRCCCMQVDCAVLEVLTSCDSGCTVHCI